MGILRQLAISFAGAIAIGFVLGAYRLWHLKRAGVKVHGRNIHFRWK